MFYNYLWSIIWSVLNKGKERKQMARRGDNIHKRKDGRWEGRYKDGFRTDGSVKYSSVYAYSYFECKKKLADAQVSQSKTVSTMHTEILFSELLVRWLFANQIRLTPVNINTVLILANDECTVLLG